MSDMRLLPFTPAASQRGLTGRARAMLYRVAMETGLRRNELRSLRAADVETESTPPCIIVHPTNTKNRKPVVQPIRMELADELRTWIQEAEFAPESLLWSHVTRHTALVLKADLEAAGIAYVDDAGRFADFHSLRHSFVSLLAQGNVHPKRAQKLARHSDVNLTLSRYSHTLLADEAQALDALPAFPSLFDADEPEQQVLKATGTDDATASHRNGDSRLPSGLPELVPFRCSDVQFCE
jgi:integrase